MELGIEVAWGEQDAFGHLNNVVYFRYCESVRMIFLERIGILTMHEKEGVGVILASAKCDFLRPVKWPQKLLMRARCSAIGITSFTMEYEVLAEDDERVAIGTSVQVMYDYRSACKVRVPDAVRSAIADLRAG